MKVLYFCSVKKTVLKIGSVIIALLMLLVSADWDIKFHYCTETHTLLGSFGQPAELCQHCLEHEHDHEQAHHHGEASHAETHDDKLQLNAKCCCEDFDQVIQFTDSFVFSQEDNFNTDIQFNYNISSFEDLSLLPLAQEVFPVFDLRKIPVFLSGRAIRVFFSSLKLNPLVF